jgi:WD40 repeat protein
MPSLLNTWISAGIGFAKHNNRGVIHLYRWTAESTRVAETRLEIDAHENGVHDLALTNLDGSLVAVSGGGDCRVKVWSATSGQLMFCFIGMADWPSRAPGPDMISVPVINKCA